MPTRFGASDTPRCPECKNLMRLTRRTPHPKRGYDFELQTFTCRVCIMRSKEAPISWARSDRDLRVAYNLEASAARAETSQPPREGAASSRTGPLYTLSTGPVLGLVVFSLGHLVPCGRLVGPSEGKHPMPLSRTDDYRMKAIACEQQASDASNPRSKRDWKELAIEWHAMRL